MEEKGKCQFLRYFNGDYIACQDNSPKQWTMTGLLLTLEVSLCEHHALVFASQGYKVQLAGVTNPDLLSA